VSITRFAAERGQGAALRGNAGRGDDHLGAQEPRDLDRGGADARGGGGDQHGFFGSELGGGGGDGVMGGDEHIGDGSRFRPGKRAGDAHQLGRIDEDELGIGAGRAGHYLLADVPAGRVWSDLGDFAGELEPRRHRLQRRVAGAKYRAGQQVGAVDPGCMDLDQDLGRFR